MKNKLNIGLLNKLEYNQAIIQGLIRTDDWIYFRTLEKYVNIHMLKAHITLYLQSFNESVKGYAY